MGIRFIYGRAGSGKTKFCLEDIKKNLNSNDSHPLILLVPEQYTFQTEKSIVNMGVKDKNLRLEVLSFKRLAYRIFSELGGLSRQYMKQAGKYMLIYKIIQENKENLKVFSKAAKQAGFIDTIAQTITEFKRYAVTPKELTEIRIDEADEELKLKIQDISLIYDKFEESINENYIDPEDDLTILYEKIDSSTIFDGAEFYIDGFSSFTVQQYRIIEKLLKKCKSVNVTLCTDCLNGSSEYDTTEVFAPSKDCEDKILKIVKDNNISYDEPINLNKEDNPRFTKCKEISYLEKHLFSFPYKPYKDEVNSISIFKSINIYSEVEEVARNIVSIVRDDSLRYSDIVVAGRDMEVYEKLIEGIFTQYNIPYFINAKRDVISNPLVVLILSAIDIYNKRWSYEGVFRYLKTGFLNLGREDINLIENYVLANGIRGNKWLENWNYRIHKGFDYKDITKEEQDLIEHINAVRENIVAPLLKFHEKFKIKKEVNELCKSIYEFLIELNVTEKMENIIQRFKDNGELDIAKEYSGVWDIVIDVLDQMVEVMGSECMQLDSFVKLLNIGFTQYKIGVVPPTLDGVLVSGVDRMKNHNGKYLFIIGVNDGVFPLAIREEGILNYSDRASLREMGIQLSEDTRAKTFGEQFLIYTSLTSTCNYLRLSYPIANHEGKAMRPSIIISRIKKLFPNINEYSNISAISTEIEHIKMIGAPSDTFNNMITQLKNGGIDDNILCIWKDVYRWYAASGTWKETLGSILEGLSYTNRVKAISKERASKLYENNKYFSVSRLENFARCPFAYFVNYGLRAEERKVYKISAPDIGTFMHNVLNEFSTLMMEEKKSWSEIDKMWCEDKISDIVDGMIAKIPGFILNSSPRYKFMSGKIKRILTNAVFIIAKHISNSNFSPSGFEVGFGRGCEYPPIKVVLSNGNEINLMGRIDRLDTMKTEDSTYVRIVDYKSGDKDFNLSDIYYGLELQLLTYLDAVLEGAKKGENIKPAAILYFKLDDPIIKATPDVEDEKIQEEIIKRLKMRGLLLEDVDVIKSMDTEINGTSKIIPAGITKDEKLNLKVTSAATLDQFNILRKHVKHTIMDLCEGIMEGNIDIKPYKRKEDTPCSYCKYSPICAFDSKMEDNKYKIIKPLSNDEVWKRLKVSSEGGEKDE